MRRIGFSEHFHGDGDAGGDSGASSGGSLAPGGGGGASDAFDNFTGDASESDFTNENGDSGGGQ